MKLNTTNPIQVDQIRITHPVEGRADTAKEIDFVVKSQYYQTPIFGSTDEYGILIAESNTTHVGGGVLRYTRTYIDAVPESHEEIQEYTLQHDEFIELPPTYSYKSFTKYYTVDKWYRVVEPTPPDVGDLPVGAELKSTVTIPAGYYNVGNPVWVPSTYYTEGGYYNQTTKWKYGGLKWNYAYRIDPVTRVNLSELKITANQNTDLTDNPSTISVPIKVKKTIEYLVLVNGPQPEHHIQPTQKTTTYGTTVIGWPRLTSTKLTPTEITQVIGVLYQRTQLTYIGK